MGRVSQHLVHTARVAEGDESEAPGPPGGWVLHHHYLCHVSELGEVFSHILWGSLPGQASYEHLARVIGNLIQIDWGQGGK